MTLTKPTILILKTDDIHPAFTVWLGSGNFIDWLAKCSVFSGSSGDG
jgi:hypothetical protein